jgi:xanthine dehydrogenase accessory factor
MPAAVHLIQSASDVGSAVAHRLKRAGCRPVLLEGAAPSATRRLMSFAGAVHAGTAELEGLLARRCDTPAAALELAAEPGVIPLLVADLDAPLPVALTLALAPAALVDARLRKKRAPPVQIGAAPLVIGIGPGFVAGVHCHVVIESNWGERLGHVLTEGGSEPYTGRHRLVQGLGRERYLYAPHAGTFRTGLDILAPVEAGQVIGHVDHTPLRAEAGGILRGLAYDGLRVESGAKLVEVEPTGDPAQCRGIGTRPGRIAQGVLEAVQRFAAAA